MPLEHDEARIGTAGPEVMETTSGVPVVESELTADMSMTEANPIADLLEIDSHPVGSEGDAYESDVEGEGEEADGVDDETVGNQDCVSENMPTEELDVESVDSSCIGRRSQRERKLSETLTLGEPTREIVLIPKSCSH